MYLLLTLATLAALVLSENSPAEPVTAGGYRLLLSLAGMALVPLTAAVASAWLAGQLRQEGRRRRAAVARLLKLVRGLHAGLWLAVAAGILYGFQWPQLVRVNWRLDHAFLLDEILILTPVLLPIVLSWAAFYRIERAVQSNAGAGCPAGPVVTGCQYLSFQVRHCMGVLLVPVVGLLAIRDGAELLLPGFRGSALAGGVYLATIVALILFFPVLLRYVWRTQPLAAGPLRARLEVVARRAGFRAREILVWNTNHLAVNAAVAGLLPHLRYVFLTDGLLEHLNDEKVEAVFGHEIGHLRHRHLLLRLSALVAPVSLWLLLGQLFPWVRERFGELASSLGGSGQVHVALVAVMGLASYMLLVFGPYCRLLERQADLFGCRMLAPEAESGPVETYVAALEGLATASGVDRDAPSWQHASIARRIEFLCRVGRDPEYEVHFQRRVRWLSALIVAAVFSPVACQILLLGLGSAKYIL